MYTLVRATPVYNTWWWVGIQVRNELTRVYTSDWDEEETRETRLEIAKSISNSAYGLFPILDFAFVLRPLTTSHRLY